MTATVSADLGGTWLRIRNDGRTQRFPAPSRLRHPGASVDQLIEMLLTALDHHVPPGVDLNISFGAALDEEKGIAHGSGPLWGGAPGGSIPLLHLLRSRRPDVRWTLVNDVTAGLASFADTFASPGDRHVAYLTVSSGIAVRTANMSDGVIPVDAQGLQGEVGHLRTPTSGPEALRHLPCACDGAGHIASIASGPAIPHVAGVLGYAYDPAWFVRDLGDGDPDAQRLLSIVVEPVAELIRTMITLDPRLDRIGIGGGVVEGLHAAYERELVTQLTQVRSYADASLGPDRIRQVVRVCQAGEIDTLAGVDAIARGSLRVTKL